MITTKVPKSEEPIEDVVDPEDDAVVEENIVEGDVWMQLVVEGPAIRLI